MTRFYSLHYLLPFVLLALVLLHLSLLHNVGSSSKLSLQLGMDTIMFYPYFFIKDLIGFIITFVCFFFFILQSPNFAMHPDNYIEANPMVTPAHIVPEWYFLSFYAILRTIPDKLGGVLAMLAAIAALAVVPLFAVSQISTYKFKSAWSGISFWLTFISFFFLLKNGALPLEEELLLINKVLIGCYFYGFAFYLVLAEHFERFFAKVSSVKVYHK